MVALVALWMGSSASQWQKIPVAAFAAVAAAAGDGPMTLERLGPEIERSRSAS